MTEETTKQLSRWERGKKATKEVVRWDYLSWARDRFGATTALHRWRPSVVSMPTWLPNHDVLIRPDEGGDRYVYDEVFRELCYAGPLGDPKVIVDIGAHIGLTSAFFSLRYPEARIIAVEPEDANFEMLKRQSALYPNITPVKAGIWNKDAWLRITNPEANSWSYIMEEVPEGKGVKAMTVDGIMGKFSLGHIDLLKMDIEGAEIPVLNDARGWIDRIGTFVIELHDYMDGMDGKCGKALDSALHGSSWHRYK